MTKEELSQLIYLKSEIKELFARIKKQEGSAESCSSIITGISYSSDLSDKVGFYTSEIADLKNELEARLCQCCQEFVRLNTYIENIGDSQMRTILALRYIKGLSWQK